MSENEFQLGDKVYHRSDPSIVWVIEKIDKEEAYCSTLLKGSAELKKEKFLFPTLQKINDSPNGGIITGIYSNERRNKHRW